MEHKHYIILEGSPQEVSCQSEKLRLEGWQFNGQLFLTRISDTIIAFQGMIKL